MFPEIAAGLSGLKAAKDIVQAMHGVQSAVEVNGVKMELQGHILDAQQGLFTAQEAQSAAAKKIADLEEKIVRLVDWSHEKARYELADAGQGSMAFRLKEGVQPSEPSHWICPQCYERGEKSYLKAERLDIGRVDTLACSRCGYDIAIRGVRHSAPARGSSFRMR